MLAVSVVAACGPAHHGGADAPSGADAAQLDGPLADGPAASGPVHVVVTADNAYSFGYGDVGGISSFTQGTRAHQAGDIFNCPVGVGPEAYDVPAASAPPGAYLYIASWDDLEVTQGVLGVFSRDSGTVLTGDMRFEVCGTGIDYSTGPDEDTGPTQDIINAQIAICNAGTGDPATTTKGWVNSAGATTPNALGKLAVGEDNSDAGGDFPITCQPTQTTDGVPADARWMWWDPADGSVADPFRSTGVNTFRAFLIFRLAADSIVIE